MEAFLERRSLQVNLLKEIEYGDIHNFLWPVVVSMYIQEKHNICLFYLMS